MASTSWMYEINTSKLRIVDRNGAVGVFKLNSEEYEVLLTVIRNAPKDLLRGWEFTEFNELFMRGAPECGMRVALVSNQRVFLVGETSSSVHVLMLSFTVPCEHFVFDAELFALGAHI